MTTCMVQKDDLEGLSIRMNGLPSSHFSIVSGPAALVPPAVPVFEGEKMKKGVTVIQT